MAKKKAQKEITVKERRAAIPQEVKDCAIEVYSNDRKDIGRPRAKIDPCQVYQLAKIHCTIQEMAATLNVSDDTLENNFSAIIKMGRQDGKASLRRNMYAETEQRNTGMMIWLSKNYLGMKDAEPAQQTQINFNVNVVEVPK